MYELEREIKDIVKELQTGSTNAPADLKRIAVSSACTPEQCNLITSAFYAVLDDAHLQSSQTDKNPPVQQAMCLTSLASILSKDLVGSGANSTLMALASHSSHLCSWILYLKNDFVDEENVDFSFRLLAKRSIIGFLRVCDPFFLRHLFDTIVSSPGIVSTLFSLWRLEIQDKRFALSDDLDPSAHLHIPAIMDSWMCAFSTRENWDWSQILLPFGGDANALAATALEHLRQDVACIPINYDLVIWDIHLITTFSINDAIRVPLLNKQSMTVLTRVVSSMVDGYATTSQHSLVAKAISYAYWYIRAYVESTQGLPWIIQTVEAGLLSAILSTERWIKHLNGEDSEDWEPLFLLVRQIVPKYSVYSSVLRPIIRQLAAIDGSGLPAKLDKNGMLFHSWSMFERLVRGRAALHHSTLSNETHVESCQNSKCDKSGPPGSFKSCAGCLHVHYCSKECQVYDWKHGGHQKYCRDIQARRADGLVSRLSKRDVRFLDRIVAQDLTLFRDRIQGAVIMLNVNPVVVELDYTDVPMAVDIGSTQTVPPKLMCECDAPMTQKWNHMVEFAQKSTSKKILVRALLPGGTSEKVKLQCLPLKRVLGDVTSTDEELTSEFDETFDLLYSRAGQSFGIVDEAFPNEALRSMREKANIQGRKI